MTGILVPFDGSESALRAVTYAITHAKQTRSVVHVLNVQRPMDDYGMVSAYVTRERYRSMASERGKTTLIPAVKRLQGSRVEYAVHILHGEIAETIVRAARRLKCDSIVMGTRGMGAIGNLVLGSVANKVIHLATIPVTLVK